MVTRATSICSMYMFYAAAATGSDRQQAVATSVAISELAIASICATDQHHFEKFVERKHLKIICKGDFSFFSGYVFVCVFLFL